MASALVIAPCCRSAVTHLPTQACTSCLAEAEGHTTETHSCRWEQYAYMPVHPARQHVAQFSPWPAGAMPHMVNAVIAHAALMSMLHLKASLAGVNLPSMMGQNGIPTTATHAEDSCIPRVAGSNRPRSWHPPPDIHKHKHACYSGHSLPPAPLAAVLASTRCAGCLHTARQATAQPAHGQASCGLQHQPASLKSCS